MSPSYQAGSCFLTHVTSLVLLVVLDYSGALPDGYINVALWKPAAQTDDYSPERIAARAVDRETDYFTHECSHTISHYDNWWVVDFLKLYQVYEVNITNRPPGYLPERLQKFTVQVSQENPLKHPGFPLSLPGQVCFYRDPPISGDYPEKIPCSSPIIGRYLTVFKAANEILAICELEVLATNVNLQPEFQVVKNKRTNATPFFTGNRIRSRLECLSLCSGPQNQTATVVQYRDNDGLCECIQASYLDNPRPLIVDSTECVMYELKNN